MRAWLRTLHHVIGDSDADACPVTPSGTPKTQPDVDGASSPENNAVAPLAPAVARGITNLGNTCFLASVVQALASTLDFVALAHDSEATRLRSSLVEAVLAVRCARTISLVRTPVTITHLRARYYAPPLRGQSARALARRT